MHTPNLLQTDDFAKIKQAKNKGLAKGHFLNQRMHENGMKNKTN